MNNTSCHHCIVVKLRCSLAEFDFQCVSKHFKAGKCCLTGGCELAEDYVKYQFGNMPQILISILLKGFFFNWHF